MSDGPPFISPDTVWVYIPVEFTVGNEPALHADSDWARTHHPDAPRIIIERWRYV